MSAETTTIGIVTALADRELPAVLRAFGVIPNTQPTIHEGDRFWRTRLKSAHGEEFSITITCIGVSGNTDTSILVERLNRLFNPELVIFVGIGCGLTKYKLGDVCTSAAVWAYEYVKCKRPVIPVLPLLSSV